MPNRTGWLRRLALAVVVLALAAALGALLRGGGARGPDDDARAAVAELAALREAVTSCNAELEAEQARFHAHEDRVDSLRAVVFAYESDERTVPAEAFDEYLEAFDAYNRSVRAWHDRAEALQAAWDSCRAITERHNALVDSLSVSGGGGAAPPRPDPDAPDRRPSATPGSAGVPDAATNAS